MPAIIGASLVAILSVTGAAGAQNPPADAAARAQVLWDGTKSGHETSVPCADFDADLARALLEAGQKVRFTAPERATVALRLAERGARCIDATSLLATTLNEISEVIYGRGQMDVSQAAAEEAAHISEALKDRALAARSWNNVGNVRYWEADTKGALEDFHRALDLWTALADQTGQARALNNIGNVCKAQGEFEAALENFARALQLLDAQGDTRRAATVTNNIAIIHFDRGQYTTALEFNRRALELNRAAGNRLGEAASLDTSGNIYRGLGAYRLALQRFQQSLEMRKSLDDRPGTMETTHNIGLVHLSQGDYELAIDAFRQGIRLNRMWNLHDDWIVAEALRNVGAAASRLGERERAEANFRASLAIAERENDQWLQGELLDDLGQSALSGGRLVEASGDFARGLAIRQRIGDEAGITETVTSLASVALAERRYPLALDLSRRAVANASSHDQIELLWGAQTVLGVTYRRMRRVDEARETLGDAVHTIERISAQVTGAEHFRQRFFGEKLSPYQELIGLRLEHGEFSDALELAERSKARVLAQLLRGNRADESAILSSEETRTETRLRAAVSSATSQVESAHDKHSADLSRLGGLESSLQSARAAMAAFEASMVAQHPQLGAVRGEVRPFTLSDARPLLADGTTAVIEYVAADRELFAFLLSGDGAGIRVEGRSIPVGRTELARRADRFRQRVSSRDFGFQEEARALNALLLQPFSGRLEGKSRLIIVPDGPLWNVPYQALLGPKGYLIERAAVSYAPSLTVLREILRLPRPEGPRTLLAMAKSEFGSQGSGRLDPLPEADVQARTIAGFYGPARSAVFVGGDATEGRFKSMAPRYTVLHLATHGVLDEASPMYSHLVLSAAGEDPTDDGRLEAWEIMRLRLLADLVVLAACDTGHGRIAPGEGVIGTMWALFAAGARSMVVSQFQVESKSATALLVGFHRRLASEPGQKTDQLRAAALELLRTPRYAHPYYWAGFIMVGDPQ